MTDVILISSPRLEGLEASLATEGLRVAKAWDCSDADALKARAMIFLGKFDAQAAGLHRFPALDLLAVVTVGYDGVDVAGLRARGVEVTHAQGVVADDVADHAMGLLIAGWRDIVRGDMLVHSGGWAPGVFASPRPSFAGLRLGIVGLGAIGQAVARRADAFGMVPAWWAPRAKDAPWPRVDSLLELARGSDVLVVACRADPSNQGLISREVIDALGPGGMIVNVARGSIVDEDALIAALREGRLGRAALDVFEIEPTPAERWADVPNALLTPHSAGATVEAMPRLIGQAVENVRRHLAGKPLLSPVA